jgi:hypothetical protein
VNSLSLHPHRHLRHRHRHRARRWVRTSMSVNSSSSCSVVGVNLAGGGSSVELHQRSLNSRLSPSASAHQTIRPMREPTSDEAEQTRDDEQEGAHDRPHRRSSGPTRAHLMHAPNETSPDAPRLNMNGHAGDNNNNPTVQPDDTLTNLASPSLLLTLPASSSTLVEPLSTGGAGSQYAVHAQSTLSTKPNRTDSTTPESVPTLEGPKNPTHQRASSKATKRTSLATHTSHVQTGPKLKTKP